jgi:hypothetical protein
MSNEKAAVPNQRGEAMVKHIRIDGGGRIVDADRRVHVTKRGSDGADRVQWLAPGGGGNYEIDFNYLAGSPFQNGKQRISLPSPPLVVTQAPGNYKYDVLKDGAVTDDPDVIIDS